MKISLERDWLNVKWDAPHSTLSWAVVGGGFAKVDCVAWRRVSNNDLTIDVDPKTWLESELRQKFGSSHAVGFLTSARIEDYSEAYAESSGVYARCVATVGLGNALRIGVVPPAPKPFGTINILVSVSHSLSVGALLEAQSLVVEARTLAMLEARIEGKHGLATGTGTDCVCVASPQGRGDLLYAGKHTPLGTVIGQATLKAVSLGIQKWKANHAVKGTGIEQKHSLHSPR